MSLEAIHARRSIRYFDDTFKVPDEDITKIVESGLIAPSSFNLQTFHFFVANKNKAKDELVPLCMNQLAARTASTLIVCVAKWDNIVETLSTQKEWIEQNNPFDERRTKEYTKTAKMLPYLFVMGPLSILGRLRGIAFWFISLIRPIYRPPYTHAQAETWAVKSTALACAQMMIAAKDLGYDTCPMEGVDAPKILKYVGANKSKHSLTMIIAVGKKSEKNKDAPRWRLAYKDLVTHL